MSTWLDKPDGDGLWWKQTKRGDIGLFLIEGNRWRLVLGCDGASAIEGGIYEMHVSGQAKWQRCELTKPEPYKPPTPPKVEWFVASGGKRFVLQTQTTWVAFDEDGRQCNCGHGKCHYTELVPMEPPT